MTYLDSSSGTTTLVANTLYTGADFRGTAVLAMGAYTATFNDDDAGLYFYDDFDITYSAGAKFVIDNNVDLVEFEGDNLGVFGATFPPIEVIGSEGVSILTIRCESWTQSDGLLQSDSAQELDVLGDFRMTGGELNGAIVSVGGVALARNITITNCDFSGGSTLYAIGCTNGGGNTNVTFVVTTTWNTNAGDGDFSTAGNWTNGVPDATLAAVITGAGAITTLGGGTALTWDWSAYTGTVNVSAQPILTSSIDFTLAAGMTLSADYKLKVYFGGSGALTTAGKKLGRLDSSAISDVDIELLDNVLVYGVDVYGDPTIGLTMHGRTVSLTGDSAYLYVDSGAFVSYTAGAKFIFTPLVSPAFDMSLWSTAPLPPCEMHGADATALLDVDHNTTVASWTQDGGTLKGNGGALTVTGNFAVTGDALTDLDCVVGGTAEAHDTTITNCDFTGGTELDATDNCVDGGGNVNVSFTSGPPTYALTVTAGTGDGSYEEGVVVTILADNPSAGDCFTAWTSNTAQLPAAPLNASTTFTMPASAVTLTANYTTAYVPADHIPPRGFGFGMSLRF